MLPEKITARSLGKKKKSGERITALTAYDFPTAAILSRAGIDLILVGDSLGMVLHGRSNTLEVTLENIIYHTRMVANALPRSMIVADMPYGSFHVSCEDAVKNAIRCIKEGGAEAVKIEGGSKRFPAIKAILDAEIPVMGHLGLTPQSVNMLGGFKVQGRAREQAREIYRDALELEKLGIFMLLLESVPWQLAKKIASELSIPVIGIGAGSEVDGQILVFHDLTGLNSTYLPKFARRYLDLDESIAKAVESYISDVVRGGFPGEQETYRSDIDDIEEFLK